MKQSIHSRWIILAALAAGLIILLGLVQSITAAPAAPTEDTDIYVPVAYRSPPTLTPTPTPTPLPTPTPSPTPIPTSMIEFRGLWVSRFDWTSYGQAADPARIDEIIDNASLAGFNVIFFQVRGTADAFYKSDLEPWASRVSGGDLGQAPPTDWDPLAYMIEKAHAADIQVHAYVNVYPLWNCGSEPPNDITPQHLYHQIAAEHGTTDGTPNGVLWNESGEEYCSTYHRATPASLFFDDHLVAVLQDMVGRYDLDGLHLDHIRYAGPTASCDPVSESRYGADCFSDSGYGDWQRRQVNGTVERVFNDVVSLKPDMWYSAAVWPIYQDYWNWQLRTGYDSYYQDSKAWIRDGYMDSISPMIYPANFSGDSFWTQARWELLVDNFQSDAAGRAIIPGIGSGYNDFAEISNRIEAAREIGTLGHSLFSYSGLNTQGYFDDLAAGPYALPATVPEISWRDTQP